MTLELDGAMAFHGMVELLSWDHSSASGARIKLGLEGRESLEHFDRATRRTSRKAGQRYRAFWQDADGEETDANLPGELWFCGANWAHQSGAYVRFAVTPEDLEGMMEFATRDQRGNSVGQQWFLALVQVDDDEQPVDQEYAKAVDWAADLKGGPHSKAAARLCRDRDFQAWVRHADRLEELPDPEYCDYFIKRRCGIHTKRLLDHEDPNTGEKFWDRYIRWVQRPFITWAETHGLGT